MGQNYRISPNVISNLGMRRRSTIFNLLLIPWQNHSKEQVMRNHLCFLSEKKLAHNMFHKVGDSCLGLVYTPPQIIVWRCSSILCFGIRWLTHTQLINVNNFVHMQEDIQSVWHDALWLAQIILLPRRAFDEIRAQILANMKMLIRVPVHLRVWFYSNSKKWPKRN